MAWVTKAALSSLADVSAAALVSQPTQTRAAVDARVRAGAADAVADAIADSDTVEAAAVAAMQDAAVQAQLSWAKGALAASTSLDDLTDEGIYRAETFTVGNSITGKPSWATGNAFSVTVWRGSGGSTPVVFQEFEQGDAFGLKSAIRFRFGGVWQGWVDRNPTIPTPWYKGSIPSSANLDDLETGQYYAFTAAAESVLGLPAGTPGGAVSIVRQGASGGQFLFQTATSPAQLWSAHRTGSGWTVPAQLTGGESVEIPSNEAGLKNQILVEDFTRRRGGIRWTTTGVVALRFDHGLDKFNSLIRPHLERLNLPYSLALNSRNWDIAENDGVTPAMVNGWVEDGLAEIWNHGTDHIGSKDPAVWTEKIVAGRDELAAQLPAASIDGFVVPGTGGVGYGDFIVGSSPSEFMDTPAGQLLLSTHAVVTGAIPNSGNVILDGRIRNGLNHTGFGSSTLASFQSSVTSVANSGVGRVFMMHPSQMEGEGYDDETAFAAKLDWLADERDAGRVKVVGHYDLLLHAIAPGV